MEEIAQLQADSRYIPLTQQDYCCVPTSIQMVMYRLGIPLVPAEELGYHLGLVVPPEDAHLFYGARVSEEPPSDAGYGTNIQDVRYEPNQAFKKLNIPLRFSIKRIGDISDQQALLDILWSVEADNSDALLCYNHGVIRGEYQPYSGHVVVFDRIIDSMVRIVDASWKLPKWRLIEPGLLHKAMAKHGDANGGGVWLLTRK